MNDRYTAAGVAAAVAAGRRLGLPADRPEILAFGANVLVRLGPAVARVPATTLITRPDTEYRLACDVAISTFLAERDVPVVEPWEDPGPHVVDGLPVTLWRFTRHDPGYRFTPAEVGVLLSDLHEALRDYPGELPVDPVTELHRALEVFRDELPADRLRALADELVLDGPAQPLHGDAHAGNLLATPDGPRWLDFEDTWLGPIGWDLACLARSPRIDGNAAVAAYAGPVPDLTPFLRLRSLQSVWWLFSVARRFPERRDEARAALAEALNTLPPVEDR
ncbi:phosphotransferase [Amycolatopsis pigmentata]|uniref:Phosphotransferase n=1 Tax=Amycolatopsis pigmentata TaxID=450801 RepID=A0ABW5G2I6_9PSEU